MAVMDDYDKERLDRAMDAIADLQRRVENLERYTCGSRERVEEAAKKIVVEPLRKWRK